MQCLAQCRCRCKSSAYSFGIYAVVKHVDEAAISFEIDLRSYLIRDKLLPICMHKCRCDELPPKWHPLAQDGQGFRRYRLAERSSSEDEEVYDYKDSERRRR